MTLSALLMGLFGGLALFLFGMEQMATALKFVAGARMKSILARLTSNRLAAVFTGAFVTAVIQSSSVTTVLVVGFISAGLLSLAQSIGVIMGANIGTTVTAQIIAFRVTEYALLLVASGFAASFVSKRESARHYGNLAMGLGLVFFGMGVMGDAMAPLRSFPPFLDAMARMESPVFGILAGMVFTALVQSSSATTGVVIVMAGQGLMTLNTGIALSFGANVGTCITAVLASLGKPREALRAALVHVVFNVAGVLVWVFFIDTLAQLSTWLSPAASDLSGASRAAAETPRQIANAHTVFNVSNTLLFLPFSTQFARLVEWLVPDRPMAEEELVKARFLDEELLPTPALALDRARLELRHLGERVEEMLEASVPAVLTGSRKRLSEVGKLDDSVDALHGHIISYLGKISQTPLTEAQTDDFLKLLEAANDLESIGDVIETNLMALGRQRLDYGFEVSEPTKKVLGDFHQAVLRSLRDALLAVTEKDEEAALRVVNMKPAIHRLADSAAFHESQRLVAAEPNRLPAYTVEIDVLENLKRVYYYCKRIAREVASQRTSEKAAV